jgi:plastocyanin
MAEIKISYTAVPPGQVGPRPQKVKRGDACRFTSTDPGTLEVEFTNGSPTNTTKFKKDESFVAETPGRFRFKCTLTPPGGGTPRVLDPNVGGEIDVG